jgi:hypothetical protein
MRFDFVRARHARISGQQVRGNETRKQRQPVATEWRRVETAALNYSWYG